MLVNPHLIKVESGGGGGGEADYIRDQLFFCVKRDSTVSNIRTQYLKDEQFDLNTAALTCEVCLNLNSETSDNSYLFYTSADSGGYPPEVGITITTSSSDVGANSDYAFIVFAPEDLRELVAHENLNWGDTHTITFTCSAPQNYGTGTATIYIDGVQQSQTFSFNSYIDSNNKAIDIFEVWGTGTDDKAKGNIYSLRIYNKVLSQAEITQNYNADVENFG